MEKLNHVFIVTCYQNIVGVYSSQEDAQQIQNEYISKNRPADILCRPVMYPLNFPKK